MAARLDALHRAYAERPADLPGPPRPDAPAFAALARALEGPRLGPKAHAVGAAFVELVALEHGVLHGAPVTAARLAALAAAGDEDALARSARRLPDAALRAEAERALVRLRVARSPRPEVRAEAEAVAEAVLRLGVNPVSLAAHPVTVAVLDPARLPVRRVVVLQSPHAETAALLGVADAHPTPSALPDVPLRGALRVELAGLPDPVTVCAAGRPLDPTPCLAAADVVTDGPLARVEADGVVELARAVPQDAVLALARAGGRLEVPLSVGGRAVARIAWPVTFARPDDLVLASVGDGAPGPDLEVRVERLDAERLVYAIDGVGRTLRLVVQWADAPAFHVVGRGGAGAAGYRGAFGTDGVKGAAGTGAACAPFGDAAGTPATPGGSGGPGGAGGPGGPGGPGGRGGDVRVTIVAPAALRDETLAVLRETIRSEGGPAGAGGPGGMGGTGGSGGSGGTGATCFAASGDARTLPGASSGANGPRGDSGPSGPPGLPGAAGTVRFAPR